MKPLTHIYLIWSLFALYLTALFTFPVTILGSSLGLGIGLLVTFIFLLLLYFKAETSIAHKLNLTSMTEAEQPELYHIVRELSRRLQIPAPQLKRLNTKALTIGAYGLRKSKACIVISDGLLESISRGELSALLGREITAIWYGDTCLSTWFSRFLGALEILSFSRNIDRSFQLKRKYSLKWVLSQMVVLPLALIPKHLLLSVRRNVDLTRESIKLTHLSAELAESCRKLEANYQRKVFHTRLSLSPLFLISPVSMDPLSKLLFFDSFKTNLLTSTTQRTNPT